MEFLKLKPIIDYKYMPTLDVGYMDYFNRALVFTQTNYQEQIQKVINTRFRKISPTNFFEEYAWSIYCLQESTQDTSKYFPALSKELTSFYHCFWDLNNFPKVEPIRSNILSINHNEQKFDALYKCADIMNRGIKLFGWDTYKEKFINTPEKICVLPMIGLAGAKQLSRNVGTSHDIISSERLYQYAKHWGFDNSLQLCEAIQKHVPLQLKIIELILWYSAVTFSSNV